LVRPIGDGSFGVVWLARNVLGSYRAIKVVFRRNFKDERPYQREFEGIRHFEPISRSHGGFVAIFHIGKSDTDEYFYYVMELADDCKRRKEIDPQTYKPRTLSNELARRGKRLLNECVQIGMALTVALDICINDG
jgi:serine/threonine protein kinase